MSKSAIQNQLRYIIAREQYMKPLLENEIISEEVYNEALENLYDEFEIWKYNRIQNPGVEFRKKKRETKNTLVEQNPGYISLTELARNKSQKSTGYTIQMWLRDSGTVDFLTWLEENEIESPMGNNEWTLNSISRILKNEKYKGDALLQKTYTVDYLTKTIARNRGEVAQYYVENSHQGIVSRKIFDMVQDEIKRRNKNNKSISFSSKYALTGIVFCVECGANYRRVTWSKRGKKTIVWRCIERLENGIQNCKNSPSISEDKLKDAILSGLSQISPNVSDVSEMVKSEIGAIIHKNDEQNEYTIKSKIKKLEKEVQVLNQIVNEADDNKVYLDKIKVCEDELVRLNSKFIGCTKSEMNDIDTFINENEVNMLEYFDAVVSNTVESVLIVSQNRIKIKYVGGIEITNGFDLAHGLPTSYKDFLEFCKIVKWIYSPNEHDFLRDFSREDIDSWDTNSDIKKIVLDAFEKRIVRKRNDYGNTNQHKNIVKRRCCRMGEN